jgi:flagella basal body P-ring formation protein FlgA
MRRSVPADASIRVVDMSHLAIPSGHLDFPVSGLEPLAVGNSEGQLWRGFVQYTETRRVAVWARVAVTVTYQAVVAVRNLVANTPVPAASLQLDTRTGFLKRQPAATRIEDVAGKVLRRPISAGDVVPISVLDDPPAVRRGDLVRVEVRSGFAVLHFDAVAESNVRAGDFAEFRNPVNGKMIRARVEDGSNALVIVGRGPS